jgi:predicted chitinase
MDQNELQYTMKAVYSQYPWAGEETAEQLAGLTRSNSIKTTALATAIVRLNSASDAKALLNNIKETANQLDQSVIDGREKLQQADKNIRRLGRASLSGSSQSGLESMIELAGAGAEAMDHAASSLASAGGKIGKVASGFSWATGGAVALTGVGAAFAKIITTQEKDLRTMIDMGMVLGNTSDYTHMRGNAVAAGMSLTDYAAMVQNTSEFLVNIGQNNLVSGQGLMSNFLTDDKKIKRVKNFGYSPKVLSGLLAEESEQLYKLNQINELNDADQTRVIDSFEAANSMGIYLADTLGVQRSALLESRKMIREDADFQLAMNQNSAYLNKTYGEGAAKKVQESADWLAMLGNATLGETITKMLTDTFTGTVSDIQYDTSAINNIQNEQLAAMLQRLDPGVFEGMMDFLSTGAQGKINGPEENAAKFREILLLIKNSPTLSGIDPTSIEVNRLIASMNLLPEEYFSGTEAEMRAKMESASEAIDGADDSIEILGGLSKAFLKAQHTFTPGFETMGTVMGVLESSVGTFADFWRDIFGLDRTAETSMELALEKDKKHIGPGERFYIDHNYSVGGSAPIKTNTVPGYDDESNAIVDKANKEAAYKEMISIRTLIKTTQDEMYIVSSDIKKTGYKTLVDEVANIEAKIKTASTKGEDISGLQLELVNAQKKLTEAEAIAQPLIDQRDMLKERIGHLASYQDQLGSYIGDKGKIRRNRLSEYEQGSSLQGIVIAQLKEQGITDPVAQANILGMIQGESAFRVIEEQSYAKTSNIRIRAALGNRVKGLNDDQLDKLKKDPKAFFDYVYGGDMGNEGEGYKYRGRGFIQLTGKENYKLVGEMIGQDLVGNPDLMLDPNISAAASAAYFNLPWWQEYKSDLGNMDTVYRVVYGKTATSSGRTADLNQRTDYANQFLNAMNTGQITEAKQVTPEIQALQTQIIDILKIVEGDIPLTEGQETELATLEAQLADEMRKLKIEMSGEQ